MPNLFASINSMNSIFFMIMEKDHKNVEEFHYFWNYIIYSCYYIIY